jgi:pimeloyl-ACP methyl ester carboxylesterase
VRALPWLSPGHPSPTLWTSGPIDPASPEALSGIREEGGRFALAADPMINAAVGPAVEEFVAAAKAPIRLAAGANDPMVTLADMRGLHPEPVVIEGAGHNPHVEQPKACGISFAERLPDPASRY